MNILTLPVSKRWFDLIKKGVKTEEYREIKYYWLKRLYYFGYIESWPMMNSILYDLRNDNHIDEVMAWFEIEPRFNAGCSSDYTHVLFTCGYPSSSDLDRRILKEITDITIGKPQKGMCPDEFLDTNYIIIKFR